VKIMKNVKKYLLMAAAVAVLGQAAYARHNEIGHEPVLIGKGQTYTGDVSTDKSITVDGVLDGDAVAVGGSSVTINGQVNGDLISVGGAAFIPGTVTGDVNVVGASVEVAGKVGGEIHSVGSSVKLSGTGEIDGDVSSLGGSFSKGPKTTLRGEMHSFDMSVLRTVLPRVLKVAQASGNSGRNYGAGSGDWQNPLLVGGLVGLGLLIFFSMLATGIILLIIPAIFFPRHVEHNAALIAGDMWRACGVGALMIVGFFPGLLVLLVSVLGIPLIPFALLIYGAACVLGLSAFSVVLQQRFFEGIKKAGPVSLAGKVAAGYGIMAGLMFFGKVIPLVGGILSLIGFLLIVFGTMLGLGAAWVTRMGSRPAPIVPVPAPVAPVYAAPAPAAAPAAAPVTPGQPPVNPPPAQ
jgi:hypothetical protein